MGYNGKRVDSFTGKYDYGFRDYDPMRMRWMTIDPIKDGVNWYVYVGNDPINFIDLWGVEDIVVINMIDRDNNFNNRAYNLLVDTSFDDIIGGDEATAENLINNELTNDESKKNSCCSPWR